MNVKFGAKVLEATIPSQGQTIRNTTALSDLPFAMVLNPINGTPPSGYDTNSRFSTYFDGADGTLSISNDRTSDTLLKAKQVEEDNTVKLRIIIDDEKLNTTPISGGENGADKYTGENIMPFIKGFLLGRGFSQSNINISRLPGLNIQQATAKLDAKA